MDKNTVQDMQILTDSLHAMLQQVGNGQALELAEVQRKTLNLAINNHIAAKNLALSRMRVFQERYAVEQYVKPDFDVVEMAFGSNGSVTLHYLNLGINASTVADLAKVSAEFATTEKLPAAIAKEQWALKTFLEETASKFWLVQNPAEGGIWSWFVSPARAIVQEYAHYDMYDGAEWATMRDLFFKRSMKIEHAPAMYVNLWDSSTQFMPWTPPK